MIRVKYVNIAKGAKENSINTLNNNNQDFCNINYLNEEIENSKIGTLEKNYTVLNGEYPFRDSNTNIAYISTLISDENGQFSNDVILTRQYDNRYSSPRNYFLL